MSRKRRDALKFTRPLLKVKYVGSSVTSMQSKPLSVWLWHAVTTITFVQKCKLCKFTKVSHHTPNLDGWVNKKKTGSWIAAPQATLPILLFLPFFSTFCSTLLFDLWRYSVWKHILLNNINARLYTHETKICYRTTTCPDHPIICTNFQRYSHHLAQHSGRGASKCVKQWKSQSKLTLLLLWYYHSTW